jgi:hypothetical protein
LKAYVAGVHDSRQILRTGHLQRIIRYNHRWLCLGEIDHGAFDFLKRWIEWKELRALWSSGGGDPVTLNVDAILLLYSVTDYANATIDLVRII